MCTFTVIGLNVTWYLLWFNFRQDISGKLIVGSSNTELEGKIFFFIYFQGALSLKRWCWLTVERAIPLNCPHMLGEHSQPGEMKFVVIDVKYQNENHSHLAQQINTITVALYSAV